MKKIIFGLCLLLLISSCTKSNEQEDILLASNLKKEALPLKDTLTSRQDFIEALDYLAFYQIKETVYFKVEAEYAKKINNIYQEFQEAYQAADLADVYPVNIDEKKYESAKLVGIKYSLTKDLATIKASKEYSDKIVKNYDYETHESKGFSLPIETKEKISCFNSEQLYYLAMHNYQPVPQKGSIAEDLYAKAKEIIFTHVKETDSDFLKIKKIYDYLTTEIHYDKETANSSDPTLAKRQAYYLEGVFLNKAAVCDGKSKAYALLLNMLGIPCLRTTGLSYKGDHAWNIIKYQDKWYLSCSTIAQKNYVEQIGIVMNDYQTLLFSLADFGPMKWSYVPQKNLDIYAKLANEPLAIYKLLGNNELNFEVRSTAEVSALLATLNSRFVKDSKIEIKYLGEESKRFEERLKKLLKDDKDIMILKVSRGDTIYQFLR